MTDRDLGLRVFRCEDDGYWVAPGIGCVSYEWENYRDGAFHPCWRAQADGELSDGGWSGPEFATCREAKISLLASMLWDDQAFRDRLLKACGADGPF